MRLRFPPLAGGVIQGLNDAGIETFEGDYPHFVVRECAQNSLDAAASHEKPVRMEIQSTLCQFPSCPSFPICGKPCTRAKASGGHSRSRLNFLIEG